MQKLTNIIKTYKTGTVLVFEIGKIAYEDKAKNLLEDEELKNPFCYDFIKSIEVENLGNKAIVIAFYELRKLEELTQLLQNN